MAPPVAPDHDGLVVDLLQEARDGSTEELGRLFEACRNYLILIARRELHGPLRAKVDAADLVQETFIEAQRDFAAFRGDSGAQLLGWLRGILRHNLMDLARRFETCGRCLSQEVRLSPPGDACARIVSLVVDRRTICEQLIAQEWRRALDAAVKRLPPSYQQVLHLRCDQRQSFAEIGSCLQRSPEAVRKLWRRALERLRPQLKAYRDA